MGWLRISIILLLGGLWLRVLRVGGGYLSSTNSSNTYLTLTLLPPVALLSPVLLGRLSLPCLPLPALWSHPKKFDPLPVSYCPAFPASPLQPNCNMDYCVVRRDANPPGSYYVTLRELLGWASIPLIGPLVCQVLPPGIFLKSS